MEDLRFIAYNEKNAGHYDAFLRMLSEYFDEIDADRPEDSIPKKHLPRILNVIADETKKYPLWLYLCSRDDELIGFVIAQVDTRQNPLCKREGWGFIREFYVILSCRRKGYARQMCGMIEKTLYANGARDIYLTADAKTGEPFWKSMGYAFSGNIDDKNGLKIYEKRLCSSSI